MANDRLQLQVIFGAVDKLAGPLNKITQEAKGASQEINKTKEKIKELENQQKLAESFRQTKTELVKTTAEMKEAQQKLQDLTKEIKASKEPSKEQQAALKKAKETFTKLDEEQKKVRESALRLRQELRNQGVSTSEEMYKKLMAQGIATKELADHAVDLRAKIKQANTALGEQKDKLDQLNKSAEQLNKSEQQRAANKARIARLSSQANGVREKLNGSGMNMALAGAATLGVLSQPVAAYADAEDAATQLKVAMMDGAGKVPDTFAQINALATKLGDKLPGTTADYQNMMTTLVRQGMSAKGILGGLGEATAYLAVQLKMPTDQAAEFASKMQDATRTTEKDMMGLMDTIQKGFYLGVDSGNMLQAFTKMSPALDVVKKSGLEASRALAPLVVMADQAGMQGEAAGNAYRKVFQMAMDKKKVEKATKAAGIKMDFTDGKGEFGGLPKLFAELQKMKGLNTQKRLALTKGIFGDDAETLQVVALLIDKGMAGYNEVQAKMAAQADIQKRVNEQLGTLKNLWDAASGTFTNALASFGAAIAPDLKALVNWLGDTAGKLHDWSAEHPELSHNIVMTVAVVGGLLIVLGGLAMGLAALLAPLAMLSSAMAGFEIVAGIFSAAMNLVNASVFPYVAAVLVIAGLAYLLWKYWEPIKQFFVDLWKKIDQAFNDFPVLNYMFPIIGAARMIIQYWEPIKAFFMGVWEEIKTAFSGGISGIAALCANWSPIGMIYKAWQAVLSWFGIELPGKFTEFGGMLMDGIVNGVVNGMSKVKDAITGAGEKTVGWFKEKLGALGFDFGMNDKLAAMKTAAAKVATAGAVGAATPVMATLPPPKPVVPITAPAANAAKQASAAQAQAQAAANQSHTTINVHPAPGMNERDIAKHVAAELDKRDRSKAAKGRASLGDRD